MLQERSEDEAKDEQEANKKENSRFFKVISVYLFKKVLS
jgi:abortive infection bacteriophage resistance protein